MGRNLFVTASCLVLSVDGSGSFAFSTGSLFILLACVCWGLENNCTRKLSSKDPLQIVLLKGIFFRRWFTADRSVCRRESFLLVECTGGAGGRTGSLWHEHLFLCLCAEKAGRGKNQCLLRGITIYRYSTVAADFPRHSASQLFCRAWADGHRWMAVVQRPAAV